MPGKCSLLTSASASSLNLPCWRMASSDAFHLLSHLTGTLSVLCLHLANQHLSHLAILSCMVTASLPFEQARQEALGTWLWQAVSARKFGA